MLCFFLSDVATLETESVHCTISSDENGLLLYIFAGTPRTRSPHPYRLREIDHSFVVFLAYIESKNVRGLANADEI